MGEMTRLRLIKACLIFSCADQYCEVCAGRTVPLHPQEPHGSSTGEPHGSSTGEKGFLGF